MTTADLAQSTSSLRISTARNINTIVGVWFTLVIFLFVYFLIRPPYQTVFSYTMLAVCLMVGVICIVLSRTNQEALALSLLTFTCWSIPFSYMFFGTVPVRHALVGIVLMCIVLSGIFISHRGTLLITTLSIALYCIDAAFVNPLQLQATSPDAMGDDIGLIVDLMSIFFVGLVTYRQASSIKKMTSKLEESASSLRRKNERLLTQNAALQESEARFIKLMNSLGDGVYVLDSNGKVLSSNHEAERSMGYTAGSMVGAHGSDICSDWDTEGIMTQLTTAGFENTITVYGRHTPQDGPEFPVESRMSMFNMNGDPVIIAIARDIRDRIEAEKVQQQAVKMNSLGIMAGGIAHDFNNLLVAMLAQTSLAQRKITPEHGAYKAITKAVDAANRAKGLTKQLLAYSGAEIIEPELIDINTFIAENVDLLNIPTASHVTFQTNLTPDLPLVRFDRNQLQQILINLIINASEAIDKKASGTIALHTNLLEVDQISDTSGYFELEHKPYVQVQVHDNGSGMTADTIEHIFDPFFTTKETGHGLGLAAVMGMVRSHQGALMVDSTVGEGTTFEMLLPIGDPN